MRSGFTRLSALVRGRAVRRKFIGLRAIVVKIQSLARMRQCRKLFERTQRATLTVQRRYRAHLASRAARTQFLQKRTAAVAIQVRYRKFTISVAEPVQF